ncbi:MAG: T9SS type A sorting domain-containing protein, partial [Ignavibacteria bacterium]
DIVLNSITGSKENFTYSAGQYFLEFNPKISNGGTLTYTMISSELPEAFRPVNASVSGNLLRLATNMPQTENTPPILNTGILVARMRLETSAKSFAAVPLDLRWAGDESNFKTRVCIYSDNAISEITDVIDLTTDSIIPTRMGPGIKDIPKKFSIAQNYPNPFNPVTTISYEIPVDNFVTLKVYDITGRVVAVLVNENLTAGSYAASFNGTTLSSGLYFYKIEAGSFSVVNKMLLIK